MNEVSYTKYCLAIYLQGRYASDTGTKFKMFDSSTTDYGTGAKDLIFRVLQHKQCNYLGNLNIKEIQVKINIII